MQAQRLSSGRATGHWMSAAARSPFTAATIRPGHLYLPPVPPTSSERQHSSAVARAEKSRGPDWAPGLAGGEAGVPRDQRPVNELKQLKEDALFKWGALDPADYVVRLAGVFLFFFSLVGGPIAFQTFDPFKDPVEWLLSASVGSLLVVAAVVVRVYLGWSFVGNRLLSASYEYEETGWYDGQVYVKSPEVLTRDRLLGMYEVKPVLAKLKGTLVGTGAMLVVCAVLLSALQSAGADDDGMVGRASSKRGPRLVTPDGVIFSKNVTSMNQLMTDDTLAAEEAEAAGGVPGYCRDRYFRALAGGNGVCQKFD